MENRIKYTIEHDENDLIAACAAVMVCIAMDKAMTSIGLPNAKVLTRTVRERRVDIDRSNPACIAFSVQKIMGETEVQRQADSKPPVP